MILSAGFCSLLGHLFLTFITRIFILIACRIQTLLEIQLMYFLKCTFADRPVNVTNVTYEYYDGLLMKFKWDLSVNYKFTPVSPDSPINNKMNVIVSEWSSNPEK